MHALAFASLLVLSPDAAIAQATTSAPETVYVERTLHRDASPDRESRAGAAKYVVGGLAVIAGTYLALDGRNRPEVELVDRGGIPQIRSQTNPQVYLGVGIAAVGLLVVIL